MKIKRYPGKAVINDSAWLEMDISSDIRARQYEGSWEETQRHLSSVDSLAVSTWNSNSTSKLEGNLLSKLGSYQYLLEKLAQEENLYSVLLKKKEIKVKYGNDKYLPRIDSMKNVISSKLPLETEIQRSKSFIEDENLVTKLPNNLEIVIPNEDGPDRPSNVKPPQKIRQRIPPKNLCIAHSDASEEDLSPSDTTDVYNLYRDNILSPTFMTDSSSNSPMTDFLIPRPKLVVPVHTYAIRRRRTGNLPCNCEKINKDSGKALWGRTNSSP